MKANRNRRTRTSCLYHATGETRQHVCTKSIPAYYCHGVCFSYRDGESARVKRQYRWRTRCAYHHSNGAYPHLCSLPKHGSEICCGVCKEYDDSQVAVMRAKLGHANVRNKSEGKAAADRMASRCYERRRVRDALFRNGYRLRFDDTHTLDEIIEIFKCK